MDHISYDLPIELIHYILYDPVININWKTVIKCYTTSKILQVLNKRERCVLQNASKGDHHCIKTGNYKALHRCKINDEYNAFLLSCSYGRLKIAKWLIKTYPKIDIHAYHEYVFKMGCLYGHLKIVKWLIKYGNLIGTPINIHIDTECVFKMSYLNGHIHIVQWLIEHFDGFEITKFNVRELEIYNKYKYK